MRLLLVFVLTVHAISGALITSNQSFTCPHQISESIKNDWKVEGFLGDWDGIELYSHADNQHIDDTCLRVTISEVNENQNDVDPAAKPSADRHLKVELKYPSVSKINFFTLSNGKTDNWKGEDQIARVMKSDAAVLVLSFCDHDKSEVYSILLNKKTKEETYVMSNQLNKLVLTIRKLRILATTNLQFNCPAELTLKSDEAVGKASAIVPMSFMSILVVFLTKILIS